MQQWKITAAVIAGFLCFTGNSYAAQCDVSCDASDDQCRAIAPRFCTGQSSVSVCFGNGLPRFTVPCLTPPIGGGGSGGIGIPSIGDGIVIDDPIFVTPIDPIIPPNTTPGGGADDNTHCSLECTKGTAGECNEHRDEMCRNGWYDDHTGAHGMCTTVNVIYANGHQSYYICASPI
jgi:hypothetical protein